MIVWQLYSLKTVDAELAEIKKEFKGLLEIPIEQAISPYKCLSRDVSDESFCGYVSRRCTSPV
jgi:hypothetical protein